MITTLPGTVKLNSNLFSVQGNHILLPMHQKPECAKLPAGLRPGIRFRSTLEILIMLTHIILSIIIVTIAGTAFAFTSHLLGRGDKRIGCGAGKCGVCNSENEGLPCPEESKNNNHDE
ncbi:hypothetical protein K8T06_10055 [bacterium]|nr:hypothetical protein [bacterium]